VKYLIENVDYCFIVNGEEHEIADKINEILIVGMQSNNGRLKIFHSGLDQKNTVQLLLDIYASVMKKKEIHG
jgi:hypothetical protein